MHLRFGRKEMPGSIKPDSDRKFRLIRWGKRILVAGLIIGSIGLAGNLKKEDPFVRNKPDVMLIAEGFTSGKTKEKNINKTKTAIAELKKDEEKLAAGKKIKIQQAGISEAFEEGIKVIGKILKFAFEMVKVAFFLVGLLVWGIIKLALDLVKFLFSNGLEILKDIGKILWHLASETWVGKIILGGVTLIAGGLLLASFISVSRFIKPRGINERNRKFKYVSYLNIENQMNAHLSKEQREERARRRAEYDEKAARIYRRHHHSGPPRGESTYGPGEMDSVGKRQMDRLREEYKDIFGNDENK